MIYCSVDKSIKLLWKMGSVYHHGITYSIVSLPTFMEIKNEGGFLFLRNKTIVSDYWRFELSHTMAIYVLFSYQNIKIVDFFRK